MKNPDIRNNLFAGWKKGDYLVMAVLLLILANAAFYAFSHVEGSTDYGDDPNYLYLASTVVYGNFQINPGYIFSVRLMSFMPIAFFYFLFGINNLTSTLWNIVSYIGLIITAFFTVRFLCGNDRTALLSSFLVSIFPLVTQYSENISEDVPLTFILSLAILLFLQAEKKSNKWRYFASGVLLVSGWLISYEATIAIIFLFLYAFIRIIKKKMKIDRRSLFFLYGIAAAFLLVFIFSYLNSGMPLVTITTNLRFYSGIGQTVNGLPTIPTANTNLWFYPNAMFQLNVISNLFHGNLTAGINNIWNQIFPPRDAPFPYGLYFYLLVPALVLLLATREKRSYFFVIWFAFFWLFLEFGPMHVGVSLNPFSITYLLAHRLERFMMVLAVPLCAIIAMAMSKFMDLKNRYLLFTGTGLLALILAVLYINNYLISTFWYYWVYYPEGLSLEAANYLMPHVSTSNIYVDSIYDHGGVSFFGANLQTYLEYPSDPRYEAVYANASCSSFVNMSYAVWSGPPPCSRFENVLNLTVPNYIPQYVLIEEAPDLQLVPTNVYFIR